MRVGARIPGLMQDTKLARHGVGHRPPADSQQGALQAGQAWSWNTDHHQTLDRVLSRLVCLRDLFNIY